MKKGIGTEEDLSQAQPNKFAQRRLVILGDPSRQQNPPPSTGNYTYRFTFINGAQMEVAADSEKAARQWVLAYFKVARLPRGASIERLEQAA